MKRVLVLVDTTQLVVLVDTTQVICFLSLYDGNKATAKEWNQATAKEDARSNTIQLIIALDAFCVFYLTYFCNV